MKKFIKKNWLIICLILISIIRINITEKLPICAFPKEVYDDQMMVNMAKNIIEGKWLGPYDSNTLMKGVRISDILIYIKKY